VGGDRDEHGCIGSAGYSWCAVKNKCLRTWEENCGKDQAFCTAIYQPVCGMQNNNQLKTFGNSCELNNAGAKYLYDGECKNNQTNEAPANCKIWYDGCNTCSRSSVGGPLMCTMMACLNNTNNGIWNSGAYCKEYFTNSIETPTIKSFSGPVQLRVNETGTWKVEASTFNNQQLTYNITWGDEKYDYKIGASVLPYINSVFPQNTTFEHTYAYPGNYTVTVTVTAANGQSTKTTSTVNVTSNVSCYDNGTAYTEGTSRSCVYQNGYRTCIQDASYVCRNGNWKVEGSTWWNQPSACSSDTKQCPNGSQIGRSGPNCEFICPVY
jgi:hypothetical protein